MNVTTNVNPSIISNVTATTTTQAESSSTSSSALTLDKAQRENFEGVVGKKVTEAANIAVGGAIGASATALGTAGLVLVGAASFSSCYDSCCSSWSGSWSNHEIVTRMVVRIHTQPRTLL